ncbi:MAG: hypothetical protein CMK89_04870 [Pseudomonadales bacterium]|nr:hypothetical protein [Pseudomonadales bacterium]RLU02815.1 MAG: NUDIX domain-containing protein [Ketobacter sp.]
MNSRYFLATLFPLVLVACQHTPSDCGELPDDVHVGNAGCMIIHDQKVLMVQQRVSGKWSLPGGTAESGERAACTAQRETREETGLEVSLKHKILTLQNGFHLYRCAAESIDDAGSVDRLEIADWKFFDDRERKDIPWRFEAQRELIDRLVREQLQLDNEVSGHP